MGVRILESRTRKHAAKMWGTGELCTLTVEWDGYASKIIEVLRVLAADGRTNRNDRWRVRLVTKRAK